MKWRSAKNDANNGGYNAVNLQHMFQKVSKWLV